MSQDPSPPKTETVPLGTYLRRVRQGRGLQLKDLADMANTNAGLISRLETGASRPTLFAVVRVCSALGLDLESLSEVIGVTSFLTEARKGHSQQTDSQKNALMAADIERFLDLYRNDPTIVQQKLATIYGQFLLESGRGSDRENTRQAAMETIAASFDSPDSPNALKYPIDEVSKDTILEIYIAGGVITNYDIGAYIRQSRKAKAESLRRLAGKAEVEFTFLDRLERGTIDLVKFDDLIKIDKALGTAGDILSLAWSAGEFYTGVARNALAANTRPVNVWSDDEYTLAETLVKLARCDAGFVTEFRRQVLSV